MKKSILLLVYVLFIWVSCMAQQRGLATIEGLVTDLDNNPISDAIIEAELNDLYYSTTTNSEGIYSLEVEASDFGSQYFVFVTKQGYISDSATISVSIDETVELNFTLERLSSINGTIELHGDFGVNVEEIEVALMGLDTIFPNTDGFYEFVNLDTGIYNISLRDTNEFYMPVSYVVDIVENGSIVTFDKLMYPIQGSIAGQISLNRGDVTEVIVTLDDENYEPTNPDGDGFYSFDSVAPGVDYIVSASLEDYSSDPPNIEIAIEIPGEYISNADFNMILQKATITGIVTDEDDIPILGASIFVGGMSTSTTSNGGYNLPNLDLGMVTIYVMAEGYMNDTIDDVFLLPGTNEQDTIKLQYTPKITVPGIINNSIEIRPTIIGNISEIKSFQIIGEDLEDIILISTSEPFSLSIDNENFEQEISIPLNTGDSINETIYVRYEPTDTVEYSKSLLISSANAVNIHISVTGLGISQIEAHISTSNDIVCSESEVRLSAEGSTGGTGNYSYVWESDTIISEEEILFVEPLVTTTYSLTVKDTAEYESSTTKIIEVFQDLKISYPPIDFMNCAHEGASFSISLEDETDATYKWEVKYGENWEDINNEITNVIELENIQYTMNGNLYRCKYTRCNTTQISDFATLTVNALPDTTIVVKGTPPAVLIYPNTNSDSLSYQWYEGNVPIENEIKQFYSPSNGFNEESEYYVVIENDLGCTNTSEKYKVNTGKKISIYPNPATDILFINSAVKDLDTELRILITDLEGRILIKSMINSNSSNNSLSLSALKRGVYFVQIADNNGLRLHSSKIIKN